MVNMTSPTPAASGGETTRRALLQRSAAGAGALWLGGLGVSVAGAAGGRLASGLGGMNVVLFLTDQERTVQHFPRRWSEQNLPGLMKLQRYGLTFDNAFTNACMCSPARSTLMSGFYPAQHGVKYTLEANMSPPAYPQVQLPTPDVLANAATVMSAAGYTVVYKGKWHCSKPAGAAWAPSDVAAYGFSRWNPDDAGANQSIAEMGGGITNNDGRFMASVGDVTAGDEGVLEFIKSEAAASQPFFLIVSLVNPHDVLAYPSNYQAAGYSDEWLEGGIGLPATVGENLKDKPSAQEAFRKIFNLSGGLPTSRQKRNYLNFYGNLMKASDNYLVNVLAALDSVATAAGSTLYDDTLVIRTADHGEMGLAHGGLRQKNFNFYEESLRVPLVYSNPKLFAKPRRSRAMVSHVDFLPTLAGLVDAPSSARSAWAGKDYSPIVLRSNTKPVQDHIVFTYDDFQAGQARGPYVPAPQHIASIRESRWKLAQYYDTAGVAKPEWELYDLKSDPLERVNLARRGYRRTADQDVEYKRLRRKLATVRASRLQPL